MGVPSPNSVQSRALDNEALLCLDGNEKLLRHVEVRRTSAGRLWGVLAIQAVASLMVCVVVFLGVRGVQQVAQQRVMVVKKDMLCESPECIVAAASILESLAPEEEHVDPCNNFNDFVCKGWNTNHDLRPDQGDIFEGTLMSERSLQLLRHVIEDPYPESSAHSSFSPLSLADGKQDVDRANFKKLKAAYTACMNEDVITELGKKPLAEILNQVRELYPGTEKSQSVDGLSNTFIYLAEFGINPLIQFSIGADDKTPDTMALTLFNPWRIGLPSKEYYLDKEAVAGYTTAIAGYLANLSEDSKDIDFNKLAKGIVNFESKLAKASMDPEDMQDVTKTYNPMAVEDVQLLLPEISFQKILKKLSPHYAPTVIIVASKSYLTDVSKLLNEIPADVIQGYLILKTADAFSSYVSDEVNKPLREFRNVLSGKEPSSKRERWQTCVNEVDDSLGWILGRFFIEKAFSEEAKIMGDRIVSDIKNEFIVKLNTLDWISAEVRKLAIDKVHKIVQKIGYPEQSPDIRSPAELQKYYEDVNISSTTHFKNAVSSAKSQALREWDSLRKPTDHEAWGMTPPTVNAYYDPPQNEIVFPAGIMQPPVFNVKIPSYINYGAFGSVSGHELSHAFDSTGRHYDQSGNYTDWWDEKTVKNFEEKAQCFVDQYAKYYVEGPDGKPLHVNGLLTLGENIADSGGVNAAFGAWKKRDTEKPDMLLPGLHKRFSKDQLFFIAYGSWWCGKTRKEAAINRIFTDPHSPKFARIMGTMANSKDFLEAFSCPTKEVQCELW